MNNSSLSVYKDNNRHGSMRMYYNADTNLVQPTTHKKRLPTAGTLPRNPGLFQELSA